jgi:outer membrane immunogenic protein
MMRAKITMMAVAAGLALASTAATAADLKGAPPQRGYAEDSRYATSPFWTGFYFGGSLGWAFANVEHFYDRQNGKNDHGQVWSDTSSYALSAHVGYNYQFPNLVVVGIEAEIGAMGIDDDKIVIKDDDHLVIKTGMFGTIRGRLGMALGRFMPYVTAGFAWVDIENHGGNPANAARYFTISEIRPGFAVGAGADFAFSRNLIARLEYLYIDTERFTARNLENEMMRWDNNFHLVRAGLSYKF